MIGVERGPTLRKARELIERKSISSNKIQEVKDLLGSQKEVIDLLWRIKNPKLSMRFISHDWGWFSHPQKLQILSEVLTFDNVEAETALYILIECKRMIQGYADRERRIPPEFVELFKIIADSGEEEVIQRVQDIRLPGAPYLPERLRDKLFKAP